MPEARFGHASLLLFFVFANAWCEEPKPFSPPPLTVPKGYTVELVAAPDLVAHPLMGSFDDQGRLYVAANAGENLRKADLEKRLPNFVKRLEDTNGDGVFDRATMFADKMTFPQGCLWHKGSLFVASSGAIWKLTDTNDDGVADERQKLVSEFGYTGNAADVHGPFLGPDGRIYWCDGRHGHEFKDDDGKIISQGKAARIFSCQPDGTDVQSYCSGGMDNPVEVAFNSAGQMLGTVNLMYHRPRGDCLVHWQKGGVYPREDFGETLDSEFIRTGDLLCEVHNFGHVAVSGLCCYQGSRWGEGFQDSVFVTQFNTNRVVHVRLKPNGSTYRIDEINDKFLQSSSGDFHPTDVLQDADGSLLVIDTGGWFRIGCPKSEIAKSHIHGGIYRIKKSAAATLSDPRGLQLDWKSPSNRVLVQRLSDIRPAVQNRAIVALAENLKEDATLHDWQMLSGLLNAKNVELRLRVVKVLRQSQTKLGSRILVQFLNDSDARVRELSATLLLYADREILFKPTDAFVALMHAAADDSSAVRVAALHSLAQLFADEVGLVKRLAAIDPPESPDRHWRHALTYAFIKSGDRNSVREALFHPHEEIRNAAAIALEQLTSAKIASAAFELPPAFGGAKLNKAEEESLTRLEKELPSGSVDRGKIVFESKTVACSGCHRVGDRGGKVGPDFTSIGASRTHRDLLESILYPNANFSRGFAPYQVATKNGMNHAGIILGEDRESIQLGTNKEKKVSLPWKDIEQVRASSVSIMPQDVAKQLSARQIADLVAYLQSLQGKRGS